MASLRRGERGHEGSDLAGQAGRAGRRGARSRRSRSRPTRSSASRPPASAAPTCTCTRCSAPFMTPGDILGPRADGHRRGGRQRGDRPRSRRPGRDPVPDRLRQLLHVRPGPARPSARPPRSASEGMGAALFGYTKLYGAGARRPGRVPAGAAGPLRPDQGPRRPAGRPLRLPLRRAAHRLAGRRVRRRPRRAAPWPCSASARSATWPAGSPSTAAPRGSSASTWCPSGSRGRASAASRSLDLDEHDGRPRRRVREHDRRPRPRRRHRRGRHGGARLARRQARPAARRRCCPTQLAEKLMEKAGVDRLAALYTAIDIVRRGGTISLIGVYGGMADPMPMMTLFDKQIQLRMGQANVQPLGRRHPAAAHRRGPARRRRLRHPPAAADEAPRPTRCSRRRRTAP